MQLKKSYSQGSVLPPIGPGSPIRDQQVQLKYLMTDTPYHPTFWKMKQRLHSRDHQQGLEASLSTGRVPRVKELTGFAGEDPRLGRSGLQADAQAALRHLEHFRKICREGEVCLQTAPMEYPCSQVELCLAEIRQHSIGDHVWDDPVLARTKWLEDAGLLKFLGVLKKRIVASKDVTAITRAWLSLTEAEVMDEELAGLTALRLFNQEGAGQALCQNLGEATRRLRYTGTKDLRVFSQEIWKDLWNGGSIYKESDLQVQVKTKKGSQKQRSPLQSRFPQEVIIRGPLDMVEKACSLLKKGPFEVLESTEEPIEEHAAHYASLLLAIPKLAMFNLLQQGFISAVLDSCRVVPILAASLQASCDVLKLEKQVAESLESRQSATLFDACVKAVIVVSEAEPSFTTSVPASKQASNCSYWCAERGSQLLKQSAASIALAFGEKVVLHLSDSECVYTPESSCKAPPARPGKSHKEGQDDQAHCSMLCCSEYPAPPMAEDVVEEEELDKLAASEQIT